MSIRKDSLNIYKPDGIDWMGYKISKKNPYSFHHINKNGKTSISNLAILSKYSHKFLNYLERDYINIYDELNIIFKEIIETNDRPTNKHYEKVTKTILRVKKKDILDLYFYHYL